MSIYENNLLAIKETNDVLYQELIKIKTNSTFEVFAQDNLENANILDTRNNMFVYKDEPLKEIDKFIANELNKYSNYLYLYFFGIGNGHLFKKILKNKTLQKVTIIEPEIELIYIALNLVDLSQEIKSKSILIYYYENINFNYLTSNISQIETLYIKVYNLFLTSSFYDVYHDKLVDTNKIIIRIFSNILHSNGNDYFDSLVGLKQFLTNLPSMIKNPSLKELAKKAKIAESAIIISTGPSLAKQLPLLKKIKNKALLICLDASMPILELHDIKPDIVVTHERSQITSNFYKKTSKEFQKDITFLIGAVAHKDLIAARVDGTLVHYMRPTGTYFNFFEFDDWGYIGIGMSSANLAYELATLIGVKQIILIGQDLAYSKDGLSHSKGHTVGEDEWIPNENDDFIDGYGDSGKVRTMHWWKMFLNAFEIAIAKNNTITDIKTINATEGGAKIPGSIEMTFKDATKTYLNKDKKTFTLIAPSADEYKHNMSNALEKLNLAINIGNSMYNKASKLLSKITQEINTHKDIEVENIFNNIDETKLNHLFYEVDMLRQEYYGDNFQSFYTFLIGPLLMHMEFDIAKIAVLQNNTKEKKIIQKWKFIVIHHEWLLRVVANTNAIINVLKETKKEWLEINKH